MVVGAHPYTQNFSGELENKCEDKNLKLRVMSKEEELEACKLSSYNAGIRQELATEAQRDAAELKHELSQVCVLRAFTTHAPPSPPHPPARATACLCLCLTP